LEDKLEQYKFGLPTLLISGEQEIYNQTKLEIDSVTKERDIEIERDILISQIKSLSYSCA
jgi:hypothetical protein